MDQDANNVGTETPGVVDYCLRSWRALNEVIDAMTVEELRNALEFESAGRRRKSFLPRITCKIHQVLRREELAKFKGVHAKKRR